jgi:hypothetical protein
VPSSLPGSSGAISGPATSASLAATPQLASVGTNSSLLSPGSWCVGGHGEGSTAGSARQNSSSAATTAAAGHTPRSSDRSLEGWLWPRVTAAADNIDCGSSGTCGVPPRVWLVRGHDAAPNVTPAQPARLLAYHRGPLLACVLVNDGLLCAADGSDCGGGTARWQEVLGQLHAVFASHMPPLAALLHSGLPPPATLWHQQGYRYSLEDGLAACSRCGCYVTALS